MDSNKKDNGSVVAVPDRRRILKVGAGVAGALALGFPAIGYSKSDKIRIGHLTPLTGFLGALGHYARMGVFLAVEEINAAGGILGRQIDLIAEDSENPSVAASKATRLIERDHVALLLGEINSASALAISQVATRHRKLFFGTGARSDALRGKDCSRYTFHVNTSTTANVKGVGLQLIREHMLRGKKYFALTADYVFGHDLARAAKAFITANGGQVVADELVATSVTDFSPYLLKIRQAKPDLIASNLAGNQVTTFLKQFSDYGLKYPIVGFNLNINDAWASGYDNFGGIWPAIWYYLLDVPSSKAFVGRFMKKYGKPPDDHAWADYVGLKIIAQTINEVKSLDANKMISHLEEGAQFDIMKSRKGYFRGWDHQLLQQEYTVTLRPKSQVKNKWDILELSAPVPAANQPLDLVATTREENNCIM